MGSRYTSIRPLDYCLHPVRLVVDNQVQYVPCGKCDGCLLHSANEWSMRLGCEIESCPFPIFFTLTYSNDFLPVAKYVSTESDELGSYKIFTTLHDRNIRATLALNKEKKSYQPIYKLRNEDFAFFKVPVLFSGINASNYFSDTEYFPYSSKKDFQLYLKLLRKQIYERFPEKSAEEKKIRYYGISEYGSTLLRPHIHAVLFCYDQEISEYLLNDGLYSCWSMCRADLFKQHAHLCDSGCRGYITQYLTCSSNLPPIYKDARIRPWRLASKNPAIGYSEFDKKKICEDVISGVIEFSKNISRLNERYILKYPSQVVRGLFPKCYEYGTLSYNGLRAVYGIYMLPYSKNFRTGFSVESELSELADLSKRLSDDQFPYRNRCASVAKKVCEECGWNLDTYLYALDMYYYKASMCALNYWYSWMEEKSNLGEFYEIINSYHNISDYFNRYKKNTLGSSALTFVYFMNNFGYSNNEFLMKFFEGLTFKSNFVDPDYVTEVESILDDMVKMPKFNEKFGFSPNSVF